MTFFDAVKSKAAAISGKALINRKISSFGEVTEFQLDNQAKKLRIILQLKGEISPITVEAGAYELSEVGDQAFIVLSEFHSSREWLTTALNEYVGGRQFPIPSAVRAVL